MENNNEIPDFENPEETEKYLQKLQNEVYYENRTRYEHAKFLGTKVKLLVDGAPLDKNDQIFLRVVFENAIEVICGGIPTYPFKDNSPEKVILVETLRDAFVEATKTLGKYRSETEVGEILVSFLSLATDNVCTDEIRCLEFIAFTINALARPVEPITV